MYRSRQLLSYWCITGLYFNQHYLERDMFGCKLDTTIVIKILIQKHNPIKGLKKRCFFGKNFPCFSMSLVAEVILPTDLNRTDNFLLSDPNC